MKKNMLFFLPILISVAILLPASFTPNLFVFKPFGWNEVSQLLTFLLLISLFLERALEVFIITWRGGEGERRDLQIAELQTLQDRKLQQSENLANIEELDSTKKLEGLKQERAIYKSQTKRIALWTALFIGLLISGVGVRALETLINLKVFSPDEQPIFYTWQVFIFRILDTLLTGGLIAGGSDGIHKITQVFAIFLDETQSKIKNKSN